jgi:septum site-determining protein MinC
MPSSSHPHAPFELKGSLLTLTVLHVLNPDRQAFSAHLRHQAEKTPNLFKNMPIVIDLQQMTDPTHAIDFAWLQQQLREHGLIPVGVRYGTEILQQAARATGLAVLGNQIDKKSEGTTPRKKNAPSPATTLWITTPVRSGQQIYARQADLVVLAPVNHGAELLADGSIHVYDSLRGRALAGINGDTTARIFCHKLEAQLVSVAGHYRLNESLPVIQAPMVQIYLEDGKVCIEGLPGRSDTL